MKYIVTRIVKESIEIDVDYVEGYLNQASIALDRATDYERQNHWEPEATSYLVEEAHRG